VSALNQDKAWETGVTPPVNFTKPDAAIAANPLLSASVKRIFNDAVYYAQYKNGKVVPLDSAAHDPLAK
jgi:hypothetical protein